jgi:ubiquinone/menaquinone biosynthesis C-methylase UbiE
MKLNLGSGIKRFEGFLNIDSDPSCNPDYIMRLGTDFFQLEDNTVDEVLAYHVFEHIGDGFFDFLKELYRVCEHEAIIDIHVPHPRHDFFLGDLTHVRPITIENMRPLSKSWCNTQSYITSSWSGLAHQLDVDFEIITHKYLLDEVFKQIIQGIESNEQIDWMARSMNNAITEIHFKMMVIKR